MRIFIFLFSVVLWSTSNVCAQKITQLNKSYAGLNWEAALDAIKQETNTKMFFKPEWIKDKKVTVSGIGLSVEEFLSKNLGESGLKAVNYNGVIVIVANNPELYQIESRANDNLIVI